MCCFSVIQKRATEKKEAETTKVAAIQVDDLLTFRQFSKKTADDAIDVSALLLFHVVRLTNSLTGISTSMTRILVGQLGLPRFKKTSCQI